MPTVENFNFIAFKSRQHTLLFSQILSSQGYETRIISTPKSVSLGCGLSLQFSPHIIEKVLEVYRRNRVPITGIYSIRTIGNYSEISRIPG
ncbi:MAG TPA: DUF3343 domain-containing protein [Clostridia bacterium]|nr:DUF3343 domain-containing protein [Clostridia bacterium]